MEKELSRMGKKSRKKHEARSKGVKITPEVAEILRRQIEAFTAKFGHEPGPQDPIFFDPDESTPQPLEAWKVARALNPFAPPIRLTVADNKVLGHANFGIAYEGFPGHVHGGFLAAAFDQILEKAQSLTGNPGMTGTLSVRYRRPTPLLTELVFEAMVDRVEGRKVFTRGTVSANGVITAEAEGLFVAVRHERFAVEAAQSRKASPTAMNQRRRRRNLAAPEK
jgi:hypothetical protein